MLQLAPVNVDGATKALISDWECAARVVSACAASCLNMRHIETGGAVGTDELLGGKHTARQVLQEAKRITGSSVFDVFMRAQDTLTLPDIVDLEKAERTRLDM